MPASPDRESERIDRLSKDFRVGLPARNAAVALLDDVLEKGRPLDAAFAAHAAHGTLTSLSQRDRALARAIVATALRRKGQIDDVLSGLLERPIKGRRGSLASILLAAMAQLLFMESAGHAVVNLAVHQCKGDRRARHFAGLVNAVLRRVVKEGRERVEAQDAARLNTPDWLWQRWSVAYGGKAARRIAQSHLQEAALDITVKEDAEAWAARLGGVVLPTGSVRLAGKGRIEALDGYEDGAWWVQDAAAALPVQLLGDVGGKRVADLCAAPGGKTAQLAQAGAHVVAVDSSGPRRARLADNLARLSLKAEIVGADATAWQPDTPFDAVLLDAPCTATGTIRRHPDIPHLKQAGDVETLAEVQAKLLVHAATLVKPGGMLVYCTCSLEPEEGEAQVERLLGSCAHMRLDPIEPDTFCGDPDWLTDVGHLRTFPYQLDGLQPDMRGMDGFFAARFRAEPAA